MKEAARLYESGRLVDAALTYKQVVEQEPENTDALFAWASIAYERGNLENAERLLRTILSISPDHAEALIKLGTLFVMERKYGKAIAVLSKGLEYAPDDILAMNNLAISYLLSFDPWEAQRVSRMGLEREQQYGPLYMVLGKALYEQGRLSEALDAQKTALGLNPGEEIKNLCNLAQTYFQMGKRSEAENFYRSALERQPDSAHLHYCLSAVHTYERDDPHIQEMEDLLGRINKDTADLYNLHFALAKAYDQIGDYGKAFSHYAEGNRLKRATVSYSLDKFKERLNQIRTVFSGDIERHALPASKADVVPIFILGMPRSGTTLVEQILCSHPDVAAGGETMYMQQLVARYGLQDFQVCDGDIVKMPETTLKQMREEYLAKLRRHNANVRFITDKAPSNFVHIGLIRMLFPESPVLHCMRQPEGTCFSLFQTLFGSNVDYAYDLEEIAQYYNEYKKHMVFWHEKLPGFIYDVQYEDLVANQEQETRGMLEFCGLSWDDRCMEFHKTERAVKTASIQQVRTPLYKKSTHHWKNYEPYLGELLDALSA